MEWRKRWIQSLMLRCVRVVWCVCAVCGLCVCVMCCGKGGEGGKRVFFVAVALFLPPFSSFCCSHFSPLSLSLPPSSSPIFFSFCFSYITLACLSLTLIPFFCTDFFFGLHNLITCAGYLLLTGARTGATA